MKVLELGRPLGDCGHGVQTAMFKASIADSCLFHTARSRQECCAVILPHRSVHEDIQRTRVNLKTQHHIKALPS